MTHTEDILADTILARAGRLALSGGEGTVEALDATFTTMIDQVNRCLMPPLSVRARAWRTLDRDELVIEIALCAYGKEIAVQRLRTLSLAATYLLGISTTANSYLRAFNLRPRGKILGD